MKEVSSVLIAVSKELAAQAKSGMPKLQEGEEIRREWYENGTYSRETLLSGEFFLNQYDFRTRAYRRVSLGKGGEGQSLT